MLYSETIEEVPRAVLNVIKNKEEDPLRITKTSIRRALADIAAGRVYVAHIPEHLKK